MISNELAAAGYTKDQLESISAKIGPHAVGAVATLIASTLSVTSLLSVIGQTTGQISSIVNALKSYSFLDQAPVQQVKVLDGINNTLLLLRGKIPDTVTVKVDCEPDVPMIDSFGSELNQVWTHLVDNALDAMNGKGQITITARKSETRGVIVQVADSGPGSQQKYNTASSTRASPRKSPEKALDSVCTPCSTSSSTSTAVRYRSSQNPVTRCSQCGYHQNRLHREARHACWLPAACLHPCVLHLTTTSVAASMCGPEATGASRGSPVRITWRGNTENRLPASRRRKFSWSTPWPRKTHTLGAFAAG